MKFKIGDKVRIKQCPGTIWKIVEISQGLLGKSWIRCLEDVNDKTNVSKNLWFENELEHAKDNNETVTLDEVKAFAEWQTNIQLVFGMSLIYFEMWGVAVTNPWMDNTGRAELSNKQAIRYYGVKNYTKFIKEAIQALKLIKELGLKL